MSAMIVLTMLIYLMTITVFGTSCATTSNVGIDEFVKFSGRIDDNSWEVQFIELDNELMYDVEIINGDKISSFDSNSFPNPMIFIHGWLDSRLTWMLTIKSMLSIIDPNQIIIIPSLRGFGDSQIFPINQSTFNYNQFVDDIMLLLQKLGFNDVSELKLDFVGHSMGGAVSMNAAINYPDRISKLILIGSSPDFNCRSLFNFNSDLNEPTFIQRREMTKIWNDEQVQNGWITQVFSNLMDKESVKANSMAARMSFDFLSVVNITDDIIQTIKENNDTIKTMVMFGEYDIVPPEKQRKYAEQINAKIIEYKDCSHDPMYRYPQDIATKIVEFCNGNEPKQEL